MNQQIRNKVNLLKVEPRPSNDNILAQFLGGIGGVGQGIGNVIGQVGQGAGEAIGQAGTGIAGGIGQGVNLIGQGIGEMNKTPEGRLALRELVGAALRNVGQEDLGLGVQQYAQRVYQPETQRALYETQQKAEIEKELRSLEQAPLKRQADIDAAVEQFRRKEEIKAEIEAPEKQRELQEEQKLEKKKAVNAYMSAQEVISGIDNLLKEDPKTRSKRFEVAVGPVEGRTSGMALPTKKGQKSFQINQEIKTLLAQKALNTITEMKNASRTGATGFGAMNEKELGLIEADIASLDTRLSDEAFEESLNRIKKRMQKVMSQIDITEQDRLSLQQEDPLGIL